MSKATKTLIFLNTFWLAATVAKAEQLNCTSSPINADQQSVLDPSYRPPGYYDFFFNNPNGTQFWQLLDTYLERNPQVQVDKNNRQVKQQQSSSFAALIIATTYFMITFTTIRLVLHQYLLTPLLSCNFGLYLASIILQNTSRRIAHQIKNFSSLSHLP